MWKYFWPLNVHALYCYKSYFQEAIAKDSYYGKPKTIECGDVTKGFEQSEHVIEGEVHIGGQEHFYLETNATLAVPKNEDGEMELFVSTQNPTETQVRTFIVFLY